MKINHHKVKMKKNLIKYRKLISIKQNKREMMI